MIILKANYMKYNLSQSFLISSFQNDDFGGLPPKSSRFRCSHVIILDNEVEFNSSKPVLEEFHCPLLNHLSQEGLN